ncbi:MAG: hypothetical protein E7K85_09680 [Clostridium sp.]|uniref:hypothetical protein n=2 Tax=Clostridiaceae TaxID=31979 RepID=UPI000C07A8AD|nr:MULTISPECIES: hypothetical protein [Clostridium]MDB2121137.1 hypothetical protein [Clostridium paraputrificum]MDU2754535.1 hypothetical protein [Clostridium sp.]MDU2900474.1 hypothetical protein [Clostridium sp.]MDU4428215.1 hypothetical protein [Clostridium sp.]MDU7460888.1 hypothetical protein [Clostridium sp.]
MKKNRFVAKSFLLVFFLLLIINNIFSIEVKAYDYGEVSSALCNGGDPKMYSTDGGRYFQYAWNSTTEFGLKSKIREHKISMQPQGTNYWAYERGISFPEPLEIGTAFELNVAAYGYAYGSKMYAYNDLTQAQMNAKVKVVAEITLENGRIVSGDNGTMGGYNDGKKPIYKETYNYTYNTENMPKWTNGQKVKAVYLRVVDAPTIPSSGDDRYRYLYLIDSMSITVKSMTTPSNGRIYRATSDNENNDVVFETMDNGNSASLWVRPQDSVQDSGKQKPINIWMYTFQKPASSSVNRINKNYMRFVTTHNPKGDKVIDERYVINENKGYSHYNDNDSTSLINDGGHDFYRTSDTGQWEYCSKFRVGFDWDNVDYDIYIAGDSANGKGSSYEKKGTVKTDGRAPKWDNIEVNDSNYRKPIVTVKGVRDVRGDGTKERAGAGLDKQYLRVKAENKNNYVDIPEKERTKVKTENGIEYYDLTFEIDYDSKEIRSIIPSGYEKIIAQFNSYDRVGNYAQEDNIEVNDFDVSSTIERVLSPHEPIFMGGEKGVLKIKLQGGVERVKITFPQALSKLDSNLNTEMVLTPKDEENIDYEFFIPLEAVSGNYSVTVEAFKGEERKVSQPALQVKGKITDKLRTRIRLPE